MLGTLSGAMMTAARTDTLRPGAPCPARRTAPLLAARKSLVRRLRDALRTPRAN